MRLTCVTLCAAVAAGCAAGSAGPAAPAPGAATHDSPIYAVDTVATGLRNPWSLAFPPDGAILVSEKYGGLRLFPRGSADGAPIAGVPSAMQFEDGGLTPRCFALGWTETVSRMAG